MICFFSILLSLFSSSSAQVGCSDRGVGPCLSSLCDVGFTCVTAINTCCSANNLIFATTPASAPSTPTACVDKVNPRTGTSDCLMRRSLCENSVYYTLMTQQCPLTCGRCDSSSSITSTSCVDRVNPSTGVSDCLSRASLCNNPVYYSLMTEQCPATCGRCITTSGTTATRVAEVCVDRVNPSTGVSDCPSRAYLCNNSIYYSLMTEQCPVTCGRCTTTSGTTTATCADKVNPLTGTSNCAALAYLCNNSLYSTLMTEQCPATCGRCTSSNSVSSTTTCVDMVNPATGTSNCAAIASYCNNALYFNLMTERCPATCGRCNGAVTSEAATADQTTTAAAATSTTLPFIQRLACPTGWHYLMSTLSCYQLGDGRKTFSLAEADCQSKGGNLPSIHSDEENQFVRSEAVIMETNPQEQWIGMTDFGEALAFIDGTQVVYTNFDAGEPNRDYENCINYRVTPVEQWNDSLCDEEFMYVCKKPAVPV